MRTRISKKNVRFFLRQQYGFASTNQFFELTEHHATLRNKAIAQIIGEFTGYQLRSGKLVTYNPYTSKYESLNIEGFAHITTTEELFKDLSMLHRTRMQMLEQSRKRILELAKEKSRTRDADLDPSVEASQAKRQQRLRELEGKDISRPRELER